MALVVFHYHYRPGGVRRVIELGLPGIVGAASGRVRRVLLAGGEEPPEDWLAALRRSLPGVRIETVVNRLFGYRSGAGPAADPARGRVAEACRSLVRHAGPEIWAVWAHNLSLGRNFAAAAGLVAACRRRRVRLVLHHHDWWFDNRWEHLPWGRSRRPKRTDRLARWLLPTTGVVRHVGINRVDAGILARHLGRVVQWIPNPVISVRRPARAATADARAWLAEQLGDSAPVWLVPCRLLRRKNLAETMLLTRWLRPEAWLVTTAGVSSPNEAAYGDALQALVIREGWRVRFGVLARTADAAAPKVEALLQASEVVLLTSLIEGFGLPYIEAAAAHRPLIARALGNVVPDLRHLGLRLPYLYDEAWIDPSLFDLAAERRRQARWFAQLKARIPGQWSDRLTESAIHAGVHGREPVAFSRLSLAAQLEVLQSPAEHSWRCCLPYNPMLATWVERARAGRLRPAALGGRAERDLSVETFGRRWVQLVNRDTPAPDGGAGTRAQAALIRSKLQSDNLYPLLTSSPVP